MLLKNATDSWSTLCVLLCWCAPVQIVKITFCDPLLLHRTLTFKEVMLDSGLECRFSLLQIPNSLPSLIGPGPGCCGIWNNFITMTRIKGSARSKLWRKSFVSSRWWALLVLLGGGTHLPFWLGSLQGPPLTQDIAVGVSLSACKEHTVGLFPGSLWGLQEISQDVVLNERSYMEEPASGGAMALSKVWSGLLSWPPQKRIPPVNHITFLNLWLICQQAHGLSDLLRQPGNPLSRVCLFLPSHIVPSQAILFCGLNGY